MPNVLEVQIIGDVSALEKSLNEAKKLQAEYTASIEKTSAELKENIIVTNGYKKAIEDLNSAYKNGSISQKEFSKQLENLKRDEKEAGIATADLRKQLALLKREQKDLGGALNKDLTPQVGNGSNALIQLSRIAQDAPFGFTAIINNVTASGEALGYLVKQTGSVGGALKSLGASLVGSGGILLALSLVTTGIQFMIQKGITLDDVLDKIGGSANGARKDLQELNVEAVKGSADQVASMNAYVAVASNVNLSMSDRLIAVQKLQSEYPAYFGNLTKEQILNGNVGTAVREVTKALIAKAKAAALTDRIVKLAEEEEKINNSVNNSIAAQFRWYKLTKQEAFDAAVILNKQLRGQLDLEAKAGDNANKNLTKTEKIALAAYEYSQTLQGLGSELRANVAAQDKLTNSLEQSYAAQIKFDKAKEPKGAKAKVDVTPKVEAVPTFIFDPNKVQDELRKELEILKFYLGDAEKDFKNNPIKLNIPLQAVTTGSEFEAYAAKLRQAKEDTQIFADGAGAAVGSLASGLTSSLETGNAALDAFVGSVIQGFAEVVAAQITGLIAQQAVATASLATNAAVSTGNAVTAATSTAAATGPAAAFVLPALVGAAIGFIAAAFAGIKFAHGGIVPGGSFTGDKIPAMLNSGEAVMNQQQQANTLMAIANGNSNSLQGNRKSSTFNLETKLRGSDILLALKREEKSR